MKYLGILILFLFLPVKALASSEFGTKIDVRYRFDKEGVPVVEQRVSLTNRISTRYATEYSIEFQGESPKNLRAWDNKGPLKVSVSGNKIVLPFNDAVAGKDKTLNFWMIYEGTAAIHSGQTWEIIIPKLDYPEEVDSYRILLEVPKNFGRLAFVSSNPSHIDDNVYTFASPSIKKSGLVAIFGDFQTLGFDLKFKLDKPGFVALPPDTTYQKVFYTKIDPKPINITVDSDGNWLAKYDSAVEVVVSGQANVLSSPAQIVPSPSFEQLKSLTVPTKLWPKKSLDLKTPRKIYDYVIENTECCDEFSNLFVSLARTAGIPSRAIAGFGGEWPQYWDWNRAMWISVDPTHFSQFDFNHFSFFILGDPDLFPKPTDINVRVVDYKEFDEVPLETKIEMPKIIYAPFGATVYLTVTNPNPFAIYHTTLRLPPFASVRLELPIKSNFGLNLKPQSLRFRVGEMELEYNIDNSKYLLWHVTLAILTSSIIIFMGFVAHQAWSVYLQGFPRRYHLRR